MASQLYSRYIPPKKSKSTRTRTSDGDASSFHTSTQATPSATPPAKVETSTSIYTRYIPPRKSSVNAIDDTNTTELRPSLKRKLEQGKDTSFEDESTRGRKRRKEEGSGDGKPAKKKKRKQREEEVAETEKDQKKQQHGSQSSDLVSGAKFPPRSSPVPTASNILSPVEVDPAKQENKSKMKRHKEKRHELENVEGKAHPVENRKHEKVLERREKSQRRSEKLAKKAAKQIAATNGDQDAVEGDAVLEAPMELHDLVPLPQPEPKPDLPPNSTLSALPPWLSAPIRVPSTEIVPFPDVGIQHDFALALEKKGFKEALAIQSAVLPLLLPNPTQQPGDVLVSAATGSGKTLAYVLPMIEGISRNTVTRLRGLIVVPTRDLVGQVRDVCNMCATAYASSGRRQIQVGTAMGNEAFKVEQIQITSQDLRYDPVGYREQMRRANKMWESSDWGSDEEDREICQEEAVSSLPDHAIEYRPKVDVLICTPGRLVEHLKSTPGFSLEHIKWLVIDEADKLLDQSFQQWLGKVMAALPVSNTAHDRVRKVVLSATMTRDIGQLNGLKLYRPKLVVLEGASQADGEDEELSEALVLPSGLVEHAVKVDDENLKPLYLRQLLTSRDMIPATTESHTEDDKDITSSVSSTSSDPSTSDSDSDSDTPSRISPSSKPPIAPLEETTSSTQPHGVLIFTNSSTTTLRLTRLLSLLHPALTPSLAPLTSTTPSSTRTRTLHLFATHKIHILIASDLVSRGLDLPNLKHVVNYDVPGSVRAYVHRVGRTARAGKEGWCWTLLAGREAGWFWREIARGGGVSRGTRRVGRVDGLARGIGEQEREGYERALEVLGTETRGG